MKRGYVVLALLGAAVLGGGAVWALSHSSAASAQGEGETLVVYAAERDALMDAVIPLFEEKYGIQVHLVMGESETLLDRLEASGSSPEADVVMGLSLSDILERQEYFEPYISVNDKYLMEPYRSGDGLATSYVLNGSCIVLNRTLAGDRDIGSYEDLLEEELTQHLAMADPLTTSEGFDQLVNLLSTHGGYESEEAWAFVGQVLKQMGRGVLDSADQVYTGVAQGSFWVGLSREDACAGLLREGADVEIVYPAGGSLFSPRAAALVKGASHTKEGQYFLDFLISKDMQDIFGTLLTSRPVRRDAKSSPYLTDLDQISQVTLDPQALAAHRDEILDRYQQLKREITEDE